MVDHYRIIEKIGAGGMGEVYLAEDTKLGRQTALKFLPDHLCQDEECRARFKRECQAAAKLDHPNIVAIFEVGEYKGRPFFAMQYVAGESLRILIRRKKPELEELIDLGLQIGHGLKAAHQSGVTHRDIKPANILITTAGAAKIVDFGLATVAGSSDLTGSGSILGTIGYMSPEQVEGKRGDARSDIFSLGILLYEMITGKNPFKRENVGATLESILTDTPPPVVETAPGTPYSLQNVINLALNKDINQRYQHTEDMVHDLENIKQELGSGSSRERRQPSIAVLPFANLSADPEQEYFCDGMAEEIINALTQVAGLHVVARTSCFSFKGKNVDIRDIGRKLSVESVLEGSVRKSGNQLRITAQLIKAQDGYHVWSERFDRRMEDVFAIQDEIASTIVAKLKPELSATRDHKIVKHQTDEIDAYKLYLMGLFHAGKRTEENLLKSIELFEEVIKRSPGYAPAYAQLAYSYCVLPDYSPFPQREASLKAKEAVLKALEIDGSLAEAYACLGMIRTYLDWDWRGAEEAYIKAKELNPASAMVRYQYGFHLRLLARFEEAVAEIKCALDLDPLSAIFHRSLGIVYLDAGHFDDAISGARKALELDSTFPFAHSVIGLALIFKEKYQDAITEFNKEIKQTKILNIHSRAHIGIAYARMGKPDKARTIFNDLEQEYEHPHMANFALSLLSFVLGDIDKGFQLLEKGFNENDPHIRSLKCINLPDIVKSDARYTALLKKMGFSQ